MMRMITKEKSSIKPVYITSPFLVISDEINSHIIAKFNFEQPDMIHIRNYSFPTRIRRKFHLVWVEVNHIMCWNLRYFDSKMQHELVQYGSIKFWKTREKFNEKLEKTWENSGNLQKLEGIENSWTTRRKTFWKILEYSRALENSGKQW